MINTSFIHACDDAYMIESTYEENARTINELTCTLDILSQQKRDLKMFGIFTESKEEYFNESASDVIEKIGQKILDIIQKFKDFMSDLFRKWKERSWAKKDDVQKLRELEKKDPKLAARMEAYVQNGDIDMKSFKDINDFYKNCDDILKEMEKKNVDPKSIKGRWEKAKAALNDKKGAVSAIATALGLIATASGLVITYQKYKQNCEKDMLNEADTIKAKAEKRMNDLEKEIIVLNHMDQDPNRDDKYVAEKAVILANMANEVDRVSKVNVNKRMMLVRKLESSFLTKAHQTYAKAFPKSVDKINEKAGYDKYNDTHGQIMSIRKEKMKEYNRLNTVAYGAKPKTVNRGGGNK